MQHMDGRILLGNNRNFCCRFVFNWHGELLSFTTEEQPIIVVQV